ncbi:MAG: hypothetical protein ACI4WS_00855 [Oscillospiraceae bacterium]
MNILKANRYRLVDNSSFEMPLPLKFVVWKAEAPVCEYTVSDDGQISYRILTRYKELMLTTIHRQLDISDIYYLFSCRVFQDRTPFTYPILERMGLEKYNVLSILRNTHGVTPYDDYWLCFDGEELTYDDAKQDYESFLIQPESQPIPLVSYPAGGVTAAESTKAVTADVNEILHQQKVDVSEIIAENNKPVQIAPDVSYEPERVLENNKMSEDEIEALLRSCGISGDESNEVQEEAAETEPATGGMMSQEDIEKLLAAASAPAEPEPASGGMMSQEDIEKLLASANAQPEPVSAETKSEEAPSGGKMSQDDINKMLAGLLSADEPEPAPEPASGGKMSQADIEAMFAANAPAEPEPAPDPASGGKMSQADIEAMFAANAPAEPEPAPEPASGGKMSQADIEAMFAANAPAEPEPAPEPASGGKMSQADIEAMFAANAPAEPEPAPEPVSGGKMSQADIEAMFAANAPAEPEPAPEPASGGKMSQADIEAMFAVNSPAEPEPAPEPASGGKMSQADIEALLNSMREEASK